MRAVGEAQLLHAVVEAVANVERRVVARHAAAVGGADKCAFVAKVNVGSVAGVAQGWEGLVRVVQGIELVSEFQVSIYPVYEYFYRQYKKLKFCLCYKNLTRYYLLQVHHNTGFSFDFFYDY